VAKWNYEQTKAGTANAATSVFWKSFDVIDDYTLRVNLTTWQNRIMTAFGMPSSAMVSQNAWEKNGTDWMRINIVGTGPFKQVEYQQNVKYRATRFDAYWQPGKPYVDGVEYIYIKDMSTRQLSFENGEGQIINQLDPRTTSELKGKGFNILSEKSGTNVLIPDAKNDDSPWAKVKVREAAEYAIDKDALVKGFGYGYWESAYQLPSPATNVHDKAFTGERKFDKAKAKALLAEAGYPNGFKTRIVSGTQNEWLIAIKTMLAEVGIDATMEYPAGPAIMQYNMGTWKNALVSGYIFEWPNYNYGLNLWFGVPTAWFQSSGRPAGWAEKLAASLATENPEIPKMKELVRDFYTDATVVTLFYPSQMSATTKKVNDTGYYSRIQNYYWNPANVWLSK
jgi:peptide/nickel transport system substrate-binding protein